MSPLHPRIDRRELPRRRQERGHVDQISESLAYGPTEALTFNNCRCSSKTAAKRPQPDPARHQDFRVGQLFCLHILNAARRFCGSTRLLKKSYKNSEAQAGHNPGANALYTCSKTTKHLKTTNISFCWTPYIPFAHDAVEPPRENCFSSGYLFCLGLT